MMDAVRQQCIGIGKFMTEYVFSTEQLYQIYYYPGNSMAKAVSGIFGAGFPTLGEI